MHLCVLRRCHWQIICQIAANLISATLTVVLQVGSTNVFFLLQSLMYTVQSHEEQWSKVKGVMPVGHGWCFWKDPSLHLAYAQRRVRERLNSTKCDPLWELSGDHHFSAAEVADSSVNYLLSHYFSSVAPALTGRAGMEVKLQVAVVGVRYCRLFSTKLSGGVFHFIILKVGYSYSMWLCLPHNFIVFIFSVTKSSLRSSSTPEKFFKHSLSGHSGWIFAWLWSHHSFFLSPHHVKTSEHVSPNVPSYWVEQQNSWHVIQ